MLTYRPPDGFYDQPFNWVFDALGLQNGKDALNLAVQIRVGYGDFILRRVFGFNQVCPSPTGPNSLYNDGALVPPLEFPTQSVMIVDLIPVIQSSFLPITATVHWVGQQRVPC